MTHEEVGEGLRRQRDDLLCRYVEMTSPEMKKQDKWIEIGQQKHHNVDNWGQEEAKNLANVLYSLSVIKVCRPLKIDESPTHATIESEADLPIDIVVVSGETNEDCFEYAKEIYKKYFKSPRRYVVVVTRDKHGFPVDKKFRSILETDKQNTQDGPAITRPENRFTHCTYQSIIDSCFGPERDLAELERGLKEVMGI